MKFNLKQIKHAVLATFLLATLTLSACNADNTISFTPYWNANITTPQTEIYQKFEYDVSFKKSSSIVSYSIDYTNGKYVTELSTITLEDGAIGYSYKTELTIDATYTLKGESVTLNDTVKSVSTFRLAKQGLKPISSEKEIVASTPLSSEPKTVNDCYAKINCKISTSYNTDITKGETTLTTIDKEGKEILTSDSFDIPKKYTYLDNEQLLFAIRGINPLENSSPSFSVYAPFTKQLQTINVKYSVAKGQDFTFIKNGEQITQAIQYYPVDISISAQNPGATQTAWYASYKHSDSFRNVLLYLETPIAYGIGSLCYNLTNMTIEE